MSTNLSNRVTSMSESATLAMAAKAREYKAKGIDIISLSLGEPDFKTPKHIQDGAKKAIDSGKYFSYPPVNGYLDLRQAICDKLSHENGLSYEADQIVVSNGAKQSLVNLFLSLINPGDEVIVYAPYWVTYTAQVEFAGGTPVIIKGGIEQDFIASAEQLKAAITPKTKAIIFSSPCNPTGAVFTRKDFEEMAAVLQDHPDIIVIADEIYEHINYTSEMVSIASIDGMIDRTVVVNGFAKGFAMTGWRVGYIAAPKWLAKACNKIQGQLTSANCSISQRAAFTALTEDMTPTYEMKDAYLKRRDMVFDLLKDIPGVKANLPKGAFYFFPDISEYFGKSDGNQTIHNASELCMYLLDHAHVSLVTGDAFGDPNCIRISYAASEDDLKEALARIKATLSKLQ